MKNSTSTLNNNDSTDFIHEISIIIDSQLQNVAVLSAALKSTWTFFSIKEQAINRIELCLVEAVNNVIEHAYNYEKHNTIKIDSIIEKDKKIIIRISDNGKSLDKKYLNKNTLKTTSEFLDPLQTSGRGLKIIKKIMHKVEYTSSDCNILTMHYHFS